MNALKFALPQLLNNCDFTAVAMFTVVSTFGQSKNPTNQFLGSKGGDEISVESIRLCWCPPGRFIMGSPPSESGRQPGEDQVEVTLTKGFWTAKFETTQGQWRRFMGKLPGPLTGELPEGDDYPVGNVNFAETEAFCQKLSEPITQANFRRSGSSVCRPRRSGNTRVVPGRRRDGIRRQPQ